MHRKKNEEIFKSTRKAFTGSSFTQELHSMLRTNIIIESVILLLRKIEYSTTNLRMNEPLQLAALHQLEQEVESRIVFSVSNHAANEGGVHLPQKGFFRLEALFLAHFLDALPVQHLCGKINHGIHIEAHDEESIKKGTKRVRLPVYSHVHDYRVIKQQQKPFFLFVVLPS